MSRTKAKEGGVNGNTWLLESWWRSHLSKPISFMDQKERSLKLVIVTPHRSDYVVITDDLLEVAATSERGRFVRLL